MPTPIEDKFIPWGRAALKAKRPSLAYTQCCQSDAILFKNAGLISEGWMITPRGADLLATANAIGYDPEAKPAPDPEPRTQSCSDCKGKGRVPVSRSSDRNMYELMHGEPGEITVLAGWDMTCGTCKGSRVVSVTLNAVRWLRTRRARPLK